MRAMDTRVGSHYARNMDKFEDDKNSVASANWEGEAQEIQVRPTIVRRSCKHRAKFRRLIKRLRTVRL